MNLKELSILRAIIKDAAASEAETLQSNSFSLKDMADTCNYIIELYQIDEKLHALVLKKQNESKRINTHSASS